MMSQHNFLSSPKTSRLLRAEMVPTIDQVPSFEHHPRNGIWRSETVMIVFIDIWLNNDQVLRSSSFAFGPQVTSLLLLTRHSH